MKEIVAVSHYRDVSYGYNPIPTLFMRALIPCLIAVIANPMLGLAQQKRDPYDTRYLHDPTPQSASTPSAVTKPAPRGEVPVLRQDLAPALRVTPPVTQTDVEATAPTARPLATPRPRGLLSPSSVQARPLPTPMPEVETAPDGEIVSSAVTGTSDDIDLGPGNFEPRNYRFSASIREGYDDNVLLSQNRIGSWFTGFDSEFSYAGQDPRSSLEFTLYGDLITFYNRPGGDLDYNLGFNVAGAYRVSPRLAIDYSSSLSFREEPDLTLVGGTSNNVGGYLYTNNRINAAYTWTERFSTSTGYRLGAFVYTESAPAQTQDRIEQTIDQQFRFLVQPTITAVFEYRFQYIDYMNTPFNNYSNFILAGADAQLTQRLSTSFRSGIEIRDYTQGTRGGETEPYFEGTTNYEYSQNSTVTWSARYGLEESAVAGRRNNDTFRTSIGINHAFTPKISASLGGSYSHSSYGRGFVSPAFTEDALDGNAAVRYSINRNWAVELVYIHTQFLSGIAFRDYSRNRVSLGGVFSF